MSVKYERSQVAKGLCRNCKNPAEKGKTYCTFHLTKKNIEAIEFRKQRKLEGKCTRCASKLHEEMDAGFTTCVFCRGRIGQYRN